MTLNIDTSVTDDQLGQYYRRTAAIAGRLGRSLDYKDTMAALQRIHDGEMVPVRRPKKNLELVGTVSVPTRAKFVAKKHFKIDVGKEAEVRIVYLSDKFSRHFVPKVEERLQAADLHVCKLLQGMPAAGIPAELGDLRSYICMLSDMWELLRQQPKGESGILSTDDPGNIFYIRDIEYEPLIVSARWLRDRITGGWSIDAHSVWNPFDYSAGLQVLTR